MNTVFPSPPPSGGSSGNASVIPSYVARRNAANDFGEHAQAIRSIEAEQLSLQVPTNAGASFSPARWHQKRVQDTPVISYMDDPIEMGQTIGTSYVPAPVLIGDNVYVYVKVDHSEVVRLWRFPNRAADPSQKVLVGTAISKESGWNDRQVAETTCWHDADNELLHLFFKGRNQATGKLAVGYGTAPASDPLAVTVHANNPIITSPSIELALGLAASSVLDVGVTDFVRDADGLWHVFGFYATDDNDYHTCRWTGTDLFNLTFQGVVLSPPPAALGGAPFGLAYAPHVFRHPTAPYWIMLFAEGWQKDGAEITYQRVAVSSDLVTWTKLDEFFKLPLDGLEVRNHTAHMVKGGPDNSRLLLIDGQYQCWYSGSPAGHDATFLMRVSPQDARDGVARPQLLARRRTAQSVPHASSIDAGWTVVGWGTRDVDSPRGWMYFHMETDVNPEAGFGTVWTCRMAGRYQIESHLGDGFAANASGHRGLQILRNDATVPAHTIVPSNGATLRTSVSVSAIVDLVAGEQIKIRAWQNSGGALSTSAYWAEPRLMITRVD